MTVLIKILTIFPEMFASPLQSSILKRAQEHGLLQVDLVNTRDYSENKHQKVDDYPFGGGAGMVMKPDPFFRCLAATRGDRAVRTILFTPKGSTFDQAKARNLAGEDELILICGHYEGIDERVSSQVTDEISLGDFILTGGEIAALALVDAVTRLIPGVIGAAASLVEESFNNGLLEYPQYTRPPVYDGLTVPEVLLSGNHQAVDRWRRDQAVQRTFLCRPDLLAGVEWDEADQRAIDRLFGVEQADKKANLL